MNLILLLSPLAVTIVIFLLGFGIGRLVLRRWRRQFDSPLEFHCVAGGIGMGLLAHVVLLLGLAGQWRATAFAIIGCLLAGTAIVGFWPIRRNGSSQLRWSGLPAPVEVIALAALAILVACQALRTTTPSANYDVLEYHLGAVRHWLREGRIFRFPHLFYASLPFEAEMWYATGCFLEGNPLLPATPKLINFGLLLCNLATLFVLASALSGPRPFRLLACLIFAVHPLSSIGAADALNDLGLTWYAALACVVWLKWMMKRERPLFVLWAVFLGLTVCCKYTAVGLIVFPAFLFLLPAAFVVLRDSARKSQTTDAAAPRRRQYTFVQLVGDWALLGLIIAAVFSPWALKNWLHHGNPVYPLLSGLFPSPAWSPDQTSFYLEAHGRFDPSRLNNWLTYLSTIAHNLGRLGVWLMLAVAAGCIWKRKDVGVAALTAFVAVAIVFHSCLRGNPTRFLLPILPVAIALAARFIEQIHRTGSPLRAVVIAPFILWIGLGLLVAIDAPRWREIAPRFARVGTPVYAEAPAASDLIAYLFSNMSRLEALAQALGPGVVESQRFINEQTPPDSRVFLLYEARIGCFDRQVEAGSVFDKSPLVERAVGLRSGSELLDRLRSEGFDYLYVNEFELARLMDTYTPKVAFERFNVIPVFSRSADIRFAAAHRDLYPPYLQDHRFLQCKSLIQDFVETCRRRAVYAIQPGFPHGIWIAPL